MNEIVRKSLMVIIEAVVEVVADRIRKKGLKGYYKIPKRNYKSL